MYVQTRAMWSYDWFDSIPMCVYCLDACLAINKMVVHQKYTRDVTIVPIKLQARAPHASKYFPNTALHTNPPITSEKVIVTSPIIQSPEHGTTTPCVAAC